MLLVRHLWRVAGGVIVHGFRTRRLGVLLAVLVGGTVVAVTLAAQAVAPLAIYPFL